MDSSPWGPGRPLPRTLPSRRTLSAWGAQGTVPGPRPERNVAAAADQCQRLVVLTPSPPRLVPPQVLCMELPSSPAAPPWHQGSALGLCPLPGPPIARVPLLCRLLPCWGEGGERPLAPANPAPSPSRWPKFFWEVVQGRVALAYQAAPPGPRSRVSLLGAARQAVLRHPRAGGVPQAQAQDPWFFAAGGASSPASPRFESGLACRQGKCAPVRACLGHPASSLRDPKEHLLSSLMGAWPGPSGPLGSCRGKLRPLALPHQGSPSHRAGNSGAFSAGTCGGHGDSGLVALPVGPSPAASLKPDLDHMAHPFWPSPIIGNTVPRPGSGLLCKVVPGDPPVGKGTGG
ncbi:uncharacterized protein LOC119520209 [Choloepus didactylus]|uniref:uncharacterized protein LOC119520209 n=1 Tax=Choloepus didactylus TaxID=27675 RepID=UPI0018A09479|nr:uncharacterized protein LOC119520209 [Choloepus didactylus]